MCKKQFYFSIVIIFAFSTQILFAKRAETGIINEIRQAEIIVFANVTRVGDFIQRHLVIHPIEILKGDTELVGKDLELPPEETNVFFGGMTPGKKVVFLSKDSNGDWYALCDYPENYIPRLRCFTAILKDQREPAQIGNLIELLKNPSSICSQVDWSTPENDPSAGFLSALNTIKNPDSFKVIAKKFDDIAPKIQQLIINWMNITGDPRAIAILLRSLDSKDTGVRSEAANSLYFFFPGAPVVTEAFQKRLQTTDQFVYSHAVDYLIKRESSPDLETAYASLHPKNFFVLAEKAFKEGPAVDAKKYCIQILEDSSASDFTRMYLGKCIGNVLSSEEQKRYLPAFIPFLERKVEKGNWLEAQDALRIALSVQHPATLQTLIGWLNREKDPVSQQEDGFKVVMSLYAMGKEAREMGAKPLLQRLTKIFQGHNFISNQLWPMIGLVWLGNEQDYETLRNLIWQNKAPEEYKRLAMALRPVSEIADEGAFWINMIERRSDFPFNSPDLFVMRLGKLREARAIPAFVSLIEEKKRPMEKIIYQALGQMGEPGLTQLKRSIIKADLANYGPVFEEICQSQNSSFMPFIRQLVKDRTAELPSSIWACFQNYGTKDDIFILTSLDNYWKFGPNYHLRSVLAEMREKYGYDLNGPIKKKLLSK